VAMDFILHRLFRNSAFLSSVADHPLSVASFPMNASFGPAKLLNIWALLAIASRDISSLHVVLLRRSCGAGKVSDMASRNRELGPNQADSG